MGGGHWAPFWGLVSGWEESRSPEVDLSCRGTGHTAHNTENGEGSRTRQLEDLNVAGRDEFLQPGGT